MQLTGIHHLTAVTADAPQNHIFYTRTLGMRLVKKTVNQDDTSAYHLFYEDGKATPGSDYQAWTERLQSLRLPSSGPVDRFYFRSLYFREPNGILFEIATDGPGFATDEPLETLGEKLSLPPFLEGKRQQIEASLRPL